MMLISLLAALILVPAGFIFSGKFTEWLKSVGIHPSPNLSGGYDIANFDLRGPVHAGSSWPDGGQAVRRALSIQKFSVRRVAFRRWSGMGIEPRLNLCFEFEGSLPDPHNSPSKFSMTVIHVYIKAPGKAGAGHVASDKIANIDTSGMDWNYEVIVDGLHDQARVYDTLGKLVSRGLGLYVENQGAKGKAGGDSTREPGGITRITVGLPMETIGDPATGEWRYYVLVGLSDSRHPSMMLHAGAGGALTDYSGALESIGGSTPDGRPRLRPLTVNRPG